MVKTFERALRWGLVPTLVALSACSSGPKRPEPAPLSAVTAQVPAALAWQAQVGELDPLVTPVVQGAGVWVANAAVQLGPPEYFCLMLLAFTTVSAVLGSSSVTENSSSPMGKLYRACWLR